MIDNNHQPPEMIPSHAWWMRMRMMMMIIIIISVIGE
jgi:hypothetical protein